VLRTAPLERVALVEVGSNALRLVLAGVDPGAGFTVLREERVQTRLGAGLPGRLPGPAMKLTLRAIHRFLRDARRQGDVRVVAVATAAVRDAPNASRFLDTLRRREGVGLEVLSAAEEARLGALAAIATVPLRDGVVLDLGGGSLQLAAVDAGAVRRTVSLPLGAVRTTHAFFRHDPPTAAEVARLRAVVRAHVDAIRAVTAGRATLVGLGGTIRALCRIHLASDGTRGASLRGLQLRRREVTAIRARLDRMSPRRRRRVRGLKAERADIIVAGAVVVEEVMALAGHDVLTISEHGVRHGLLLRETFERAPA
jgi:exopolyphosphatase/guanosine-5'-triphosphate,3'-diphosphate pyrophosphatase